MKDTILIITSSIDETADYVEKKFCDEVSFFRLNVDCFGKYEFDIGTLSESWSIIDIQKKQKINKSDVLAIYYRKPMFPDLSEYEVQYHEMIQKDIFSVVSGIADNFDGTVLSKPYLLKKAENKVDQLLYALRNHFIIPKSYIGNGSKLCKVYGNEKSIIKPLSLGKIYYDNKCELYGTNYFSYKGEDVSLTPVYLQEYIEKQYEVRLTVIDKSFYAVRIDTKDKLDWRNDYENHHYTLIGCPFYIKKQCQKMLKHYNLSFGAFDYIVNQKNEWVFLELNPNGQWLWLEENLHLNISQKIIEHLI